ncbi:inositol monophosphatase [Bacteroidetes/Chlorobi group bacterium ChocPot_Mid]|jgi:myo-inositol-1(or 4)-monophosphatase|nr:MAG: inositol monophosphatase [Bacteroidetes/Chlorobi group bacterium ChocPot_Mid]
MLEELTKIAVEAALKSGEILRKGFGTSFEISSKEGKNNLVTEFDKLSEETIIEYIHSVFPDHVFLAEESGKTGELLKNKVRWIIDPLDGTVNFAHGIPIFSISIAAELNREIISGVVYHPLLDELFVAQKGGGAFLNDKRLNVSDNGDLDSSMLVTGFPYNVNQNPCGCIDHFVNIIKRGIPVRRLGSAALDLAYVAAGRFDGFWEINLNPWDVAAGILLVQEAGGKVSQYNGEQYWIDNDSILATNGMIHSEISSVLTKCLC